MTGVYDLDEMIASGEIEGNASAARRRLHARALEAEFFEAIRVDPEIMIEMAKAARVAAEKQARIDAAERAGLASDDPAEVTRTERTAAWRRWRRSSALASMAAYDSI